MDVVQRFLKPHEGDAEKYGPLAIHTLAIAIDTVLVRHDPNHPVLPDSSIAERAELIKDAQGLDTDEELLLASGWMKRIAYDGHIVVAATYATEADEGADENEYKLRIQMNPLEASPVMVAAGLHYLAHMYAYGEVPTGLAGNIGAHSAQIAANKVTLALGEIFRQTH